MDAFCASASRVAAPQPGGVPPGLTRSARRPCLAQFVTGRAGARIERGEAGPLRRFVRWPARDTRPTDPPSDEPTMSLLPSILRNQPLRLYLLGHVIIVLGAWLMEEMQSMLPMALAASAALMLMLPLLRQLGARFLSARKPDSERR
jgi:hypothetical protein